MPDQEHVFSVRLPTDLYEELRRYAFDHRVTQADVIREGIKRVLNESAEKE